MTDGRTNTNTGQCNPLKKTGRRVPEPSGTYLLSYHCEKFPYTDPRVVLFKITNTEDIHKSINPFMLNQMTAADAVAIINSKVKEYAEELVKRKQESENLRIENIKKLMKKKAQGQKTRGHSL